MLYSTEPSVQAQLTNAEIGRYLIAKEQNNDGDYPTAGVFAKGSIVGVVNGWYPRSPAPEAVVDLALAQYNRLP
jgi:hypothetical protein